jgi:peptidyl-tRNA hydrolase
VLGEMTSEDQKLVDDALLRAADAVISLLDDGLDVAMNRFN